MSTSRARVPSRSAFLHFRLDGRGFRARLGPGPRLRAGDDLWLDEGFHTLRRVPGPTFSDQRVTQRVRVTEVCGGVFYLKRV